LPAEIGIPLRKEYEFHVYESFVITEEMPAQGMVANQKKAEQIDSVLNPPEPVPCVWFTNLCESLPGLDYINLYPNPVADILNIDLVIQKEMKIRYRIFDLSGRMISDGITPEVYPAGGQFRHQMDVARLEQGFYLLVLTDTDGAKLTRRFVKN
jgi:hypothetical protein